jgi:hypothetical protein
MKYWNYIDIPNWEKLRNQIIEFKKVFPKSEELSECWQCYFYDTLKKELPDLVAAFATLGLTPRQMILFDNAPNDLEDKNHKTKNAVFVHIDARDDERDETDFDPTNAINIPLMNCESSHTLFFEIDLPEGRHPDDIHVYYPEYYQCGGMDLNIVKEVDRFTLDKPAVLRVNVPHGVYNPTAQVREVATFRFYEDTDHLLK